MCPSCWASNILDSPSEIGSHPKLGPTVWFIKRTMHVSKMGKGYCIVRVAQHHGTRRTNEWFVHVCSIFFNEIRTYCKTCQRWQLDFAWFSHEALISAYVLFNFLSFVCRIGLSRLKKSRPYRPERCLSQDDFHVQTIFFPIGRMHSLNDVHKWKMENKSFEANMCEDLRVPNVQLVQEKWVSWCKQTSSKHHEPM